MQKSIMVIKKKLARLCLPWSLPDPEVMLRRKIAEHDLESILAEQERQRATATVDYHMRTSAALRSQLRSLKKQHEGVQ